MDLQTHYYIDRRGNSPYLQWLAKLKDRRAKAQIILQVDRIQQGLFGDSQPIGDGLSELRIHLGQGYRVYYVKEGKSDYLIFLGGDKSSQKKDIRLAKVYWLEYQTR